MLTIFYGHTKDVYAVSQIMGVWLDAPVGSRLALSGPFSVCPNTQVHMLITFLFSHSHTHTLTLSHTHVHATMLQSYLCVVCGLHHSVSVINSTEWTSGS